MHPAVMDYVALVLRRHPSHRDGPVVELGSYNMNGGVRALFAPRAAYVGVDVRPGPGVDVVSPAHLTPARAGQGYAVAVSTEMLEHDPFWCESVGRMVSLVRDGGLVIITAAAPGRGPHGLDFSPHYRNIAPQELRTALLGAARAQGRRLTSLEVRLDPRRPMDVQASAIVEGPCR